MTSTRFIESSFCKQDVAYEVPLRPQVLCDFVGQEQVREQLDILLGAAKAREEPAPHCLFSGPPGLGKTTLSHIIANTMGSNLVVTSGPVLEKAGDLAGILANLKRGDVLFIDEIHRLSKVVEEYLYPAMEDFQLDLVVDSGTNARSVKVKLNSFTLVAATTRTGLLSAPLRSRFGYSCRLDYYEVATLERILIRSSELLQLQAQPDGLSEIAQRARGTPRIANNLLRWVRDYAQMRAGGVLTKEVAQQALRLLSIDARGLEEMDVRLLTLLIDYHQGGPVGLQTLAAALQEEPDTLEEVYEPFLLQQGLLQRTPRGRVATEAAYRYLNKPLPTKEVPCD